ncbi:type II secretion system minor pseudopilin [Dyella koreensis]|uniref:General secretion pathway protein GspK n=1 Tax=Dyella koreensis TaxID=311235 RepID=A0ABW8K890_9GAMM
MPGNINYQRGVALVVVLWACTLLAILLGGYATLTRTEALQARYQAARVRLHYLAEAGVMRGMAEFAGKNGGGWIADGRPYVLRLDEADIEIRNHDDAGKVDLNTATPEVLQGLFQVAGLDATSAQALAANVQESRDAGGKVFRDEGTQRYARAGLARGPRYTEFATPEDVQGVLGMTPTLYRRIAPFITVWSRRPTPAPAFASALILATLPGVSIESAQRFVAIRQASPPQNLPKALPNGTVIGSWRGGNVRTIVATAKGADGVRVSIHATVRLEYVRGHASVGVLRWDEGDTENGGSLQ